MGKIVKFFFFCLSMKCGKDYCLRGIILINNVGKSLIKFCKSNY